MSRTALLPRLLVAPALASILLLLPAQVAHAQEESRCQTKRCWLEVIELLLSSGFLTTLTLSGAGVYVTKAAFKDGNKKKEFDDLKERLHILETKVASKSRKESKAPGNNQ